MLQTYLVGFIKPQNKLCINLEVPISYYFQYKWPYRSCLFHLIPARYDHDHRFNGFFVEAFSTQSLFQTYPKCVSRHTWDTQLIKKHRKKKLPKAITVLKKEGGGGVRRGMIMITDSMVFFLTPSLRATEHSLEVFCPCRSSHQTKQTTASCLLPPLYSKEH